MDKLTNCEKASKFISKCKVLGINEWTFELHKDTDEVLLKSYNNPDLSSLDIIEIPEFVTYIDEDAEFNCKSKKLKIHPNKADILSDVRFLIETDTIEEMFPNDYEDILDNWYGDSKIEIETIVVSTDADYKQLCENANTGFLEIINSKRKIKNNTDEKLTAKLIQEYIIIADWDRELKQLSREDVKIAKKKGNELNMLNMILEGYGKINPVTKDILLKIDRDDIEALSYNLIDYKYGTKSDNTIDGIIHKANKDLTKINFKYNEYIGIHREFVKRNLIDVLNLASIQSQYITGDFQFNNDIFNIVLLKYTMTQYDYKVEPEYLTELFKFICKRLNEIIKEHGEYGIEQIKDYKNKNSDFHVELINIFRMAGHYDKLFGFIETKEYGLSKSKSKEFIPFGDSRSIHSYKFDITKTLERWFEYNTQLAKCLRTNKSVSTIIQLAISFDEDYILFGKETANKKVINHWIHNELNVIEQGRLFKLIKSTITWSNRHIDNTDKYLVINYEVLKELIYSGKLGKLRVEELIKQYGNNIISIKKLDRNAELNGLDDEDEPIVNIAAFRSINGLRTY